MSGPVVRIVKVGWVWLACVCGSVEPDDTAGASSGSSGSAGSSGAGSSGDDTASEPPTGGYDPFADCDLHAYLETWAGAPATDCGNLGIDAPAADWVGLRDCVLAQAGAGMPFVAAWASANRAAGMAGRAEPAPTLSSWQFIGAGWSGRGCGSVVATPDCSPGGGEACLSCVEMGMAIDSFCVSM
jgi:hypothetical protein